VGALQVLLDKGQEDDWFGSRFILTLVIVSAVCLISLVIWEWFHKAPIIDVRLFKNFNYLGANLMMFTLGILFFGSLVLMPQFLQTLLGYTAELAGLVLSGGAVVLLLTIPVIGQLTTKVQARYLIAFGWLSLACSMFYSTLRIDLLISFSAATWLRVAQVVGLGFLFVPITLVAYVGMPAEKSNAVAGMINFMRNIGSSVGTSLVTTLIARRSQYHQSILVGHTTPGSQSFQNTINALAQLLAHYGMSFPDAQRRAYASVYQVVQAQAATLAYVDTFLVLAVGAGIMFFLSFVLKKNVPGAGAAAVG
jgi:DHA2 family multidrug resistance protein